MLPGFAHAASFEEQRQAIILQLIQLIQAQISYLQSLEAGAEPTTLGSTQSAERTEQITRAVSDLTTPSMSDETPAFDAFFGAVQDGYVNLVTNAPVESIELAGATLVKYEEVNGDTVFRNTTHPAHTYELTIKGMSGTAAISNQEGTVISRWFAK